MMREVNKRVHTVRQGWPLVVQGVVPWGAPYSDPSSLPASYGSIVGRFRDEGA